LNGGGLDPLGHNQLGLQPLSQRMHALASGGC
jgi:hypothetical protein